ncbi:sodium:calcium antiporter [Halobacillus litoralis]|uniref:Sodium:calcium antiporter n=1 Tax=Halobacillus litoralis TaxID=45668 RepID=A0A845DTU6_9BACI|nr:sodium:calcium antiporter [Halobacillus litoralis]MYL20900.1 sodium:calcium antiporter [Halobacillus litoralis]MYL36259.1 sodium:calcium antiporter [Halobacillus litoralis]
MVYFIFLLSAVIVVYAAVYLNRFGDVISRKSTLSGAVVGTFLIAGATSLPELTTSLTAVYIDNPDIAVGNMLGSNVFNLLIIAVVDMIYRKRKMFNAIDEKQHMPTAVAGIVFTLIVVAALILPFDFSLFNIGIEMFILVGLYIAATRFINQGEEEEIDEAAAVGKDYSLKGAVTGFIITALLVFASGSALSISGDQLAQQTGMSSSFVGSFLIAASTSLPELVTVLVAMKMSNYGMALGSILGSNLFNLQLLAVTDIFYQKGAILQSLSSTHLPVALLSAAMLFLTVFMVNRKPKENSFRYAVPSLIMIVIYFAASYQMF